MTSSNLTITITTLENIPTPLFEEPIKFLAHGRILRDYGVYTLYIHIIMYNAWEPGQYLPESKDEGWFL